MLDLVADETSRIDSRFLEPACGSGNFLAEVLERKFSAVNAQYRSSAFERTHQALLAMMCVYGVELLEDNVKECRARLLTLLATYLGLDESDDAYRAGAHVLEANIVHGDALSMTTRGPVASPIIFSEWAYLGKGQFKRRDFRLDSLTQAGSFGEDSLFGSIGKHEIFSPVKDYPHLTVKDLASG